MQDCSYVPTDDGRVVCTRCHQPHRAAIPRLCITGPHEVTQVEDTFPSPYAWGPEEFLRGNAATLPADPNHRTIEEIKTLVETHCQPCDTFTTFGCRDFDGQGTGCNQRNRFKNRLMVRALACERFLE